MVILLPPFSLKKQFYSALCIRTKQEYGLFLPHQETLLSLLPHASLSPSVYSHFSLCSHPRGFRSNHGISVVGPQTAWAFMIVTSCPCVCCLFCWTHDVEKRRVLRSRCGQEHGGRSGVQAPSERCWGALEQGSKPTIAHMGPWDGLATH